MCDDDDDWYDDSDDYGFVKEEPDCIVCMDRSWVDAWGIRKLLARVGKIGRLNRLADDTKPLWPCPGCSATGLDWRLNRLWWWRYRLLNRLIPSRRVAYGDEPPF